MTDAELDELERLCNHASPGPWEFRHAPDPALTGSLAGPEGRIIEPLISIGTAPEGHEYTPFLRMGTVQDVAILEKSRTVIPALIADVRAARQAVAHDLLALPGAESVADQFSDAIGRLNTLLETLIQERRRYFDYGKELKAAKDESDALKARLEEIRLKRIR